MGDAECGSPGAESLLALPHTGDADRAVVGAVELHDVRRTELHRDAADAGDHGSVARRPSITVCDNARPVTGYHIRIGYNSALNADEKRAAFETLKEVVASLRDDTDRLVREVKHESVAWSDPARAAIDDALLREYAEVYRPPARDATLTIIEPIGDEPGQIMQLASGGGEAREVKERLRRAFSRLVILEMHRRGIEVNLVVA